MSLDGSTDASSMISAATAEFIDAPVGLSDPQYVAQKRKMLDAVNRIRGTGAQLDLDIPVIAVLGSQSAGKSSLIEAISGISLPRATGTCTRCPTECQLSHSSGPWCCIVSLRIVTDENGAPLGQPRRVDFGEPILSKALVTDRIRRAQCAILNPGTPSSYFLDAASDALEDRELSFSSNSVCLEISGKDIDDLSFVDLPGLIVGGEPRDSALVQQLAEQFISKESCIILLTIACETDFENQSAHRLAAQFDPKGSRTIGVLTKPDRIPPGEENGWIGRIRGDSEGGGIEYYSVKNPDSQDIRNGITYEQARERETQFFSATAPWSGLEWLYQQRLGTTKLTHRLGQALSGLISKRLPELQEELDKLLDETSDKISRLPSPPSSEPMGEILKLIGTFVRAIERLIDGTPDEDGLMQALRSPRDEFRRAIRRSAPDFRPLERNHSPSPCPPLPFLSNEEEGEEFQPSDDSGAIYVEDVKKRAELAVTRELPNNFPFIVKKQYIGVIVKLWNRPSQDLFDFTRRELIKRVKAIVEEHFAQYTHGHLKQNIMRIMQDHVQARADSAEQHIKSLIAQEREPFTMNQHYYMDYRTKFLAQYKGIREKAKSNFMQNLEGGDMQDAVNTTLASLASLGLQSIGASSLAQLLPPDQMEPAIGIMADVRAYFQVAYKRFVDNVPMGIDRTLVRGVTDGLEQALYQGLAIGGSGGSEKCRKLLSEPESIAEQRDELRKRRERLRRAKDEIVEAFA
ncbi:P-loop containing nucleoside triphosphate hydrolase protein [Gloeopeniophorella convolvens]|nr:P-loop containing nucleoside triphosphate hydrolase protein [Gloeopeniophorella convolvens]